MGYSLKSVFLSVLEPNLVCGIKSAWLHKYIRQKQKVKYTIGPLQKPDRSTTTTSEESAKALASFFHSVHKDLQVPPDFPGRVNDTIPATEQLVGHL